MGMTHKRPWDEMRKSMTWTSALLAVVFSLCGGAAQAQSQMDASLFDRGQIVYAANCAICHKPQGEGAPLAIPALKGNANLEDPFLLVYSVHQGQANMPPFPALTDEDIAAVATYLRNALGNSHGGLSVEEVVALRADMDPAPPLRSIWDGVYTQAQADRGKAVYKGPCGLCHGTKLNGVPDDQDMRPAPPLGRAKFLRNWDGRSLGAVYTYSKLTMPQSNPGFLPDDDYAAIVAHMLAVSGVPAGNEPLPSDPAVLGAIIIREAP